MADAALFEFLHMEMVAELWAHHSDPGPGVSAGSRGKEARAAAPGDAGLQGGGGGRRVLAYPSPATKAQVPPQPPLGSSLPPGDLRAAGQQLPPPHPDGLRPAVSGGSTQVPGLHLRPPARHPQHPGH
uniref:Trafficking protein particle complex subunit 6A n=1 Tax=Panthera tigris altaica TaxID=74533 RepID=A0A8C9M4J9_PANTA